jgi:hypothetical protein
MRLADQGAAVFQRQSGSDLPAFDERRLPAADLLIKRQFGNSRSLIEEACVHILAQPAGWLELVSSAGGQTSFG